MVASTKPSTTMVSARDRAAGHGQAVVRGGARAAGPAGSPAGPAGEQGTAEPVRRRETGGPRRGPQGGAAHLSTRRGFLWRRQARGQRPGRGLRQGGKRQDRVGGTGPRRGHGNQPSPRSAARRTGCDHPTRTRDGARRGGRRGGRRGQGAKRTGQHAGQAGPRTGAVHGRVGDGQRRPPAAGPRGHAGQSGADALGGRASRAGHSVRHPAAAGGWTEGRGGLEGPGRQQPADSRRGPGQPDGPVGGLAGNRPHPGQARAAAPLPGRPSR